MDSDVETDPSDYSDLEIIGYTNPNPPSTIQCKKEMNIKMEVPSSTAPMMPRMRFMNPPTIKIEQTTTTSLHQHSLFKNELNDSTKLMPALCSDDDYDDSESFNGLKLKKEEMAMDSESSYNPFGTESSDGDDDDEDYIPFIATNKTIKSQNNKKRKRPTPSIKTEQVIQCEICNETFPTWGPHKRHMLNYHDIERPYICYRCPEGPDRKRYVQRSSLEEHWLRDHEKRRDHKCPECGKGFFTKHEMRAHRKTHENELNMECEICGEVLHRYIHYRRHMNNVHGVEKAFVCKQCPEGPDRPRYASQAGLNKHIERDHLLIRNFKCPHCPKTFYEEKTLENHLRVHDGKKPYLCIHCGMRFSQRHSMKKHVIVVHLKQRRYPCPYCPKKFGSGTGMKSHVVSQHGGKEYVRFQCKVCSKQFYEVNAYRRHQLKHRPKDPKKELIKRGECFYPGCGKVYTKGNCGESLKYHLVAVHKDREYANYECVECDKLYYDRTSWRHHMKVYHGKIIE